jgi:hypothetical protein
MQTARRPAATPSVLLSSSCAHKQQPCGARMSTQPQPQCTQHANTVVHTQLCLLGCVQNKQTQLRVHIKQTHSLLHGGPLAHTIQNTNLRLSPATSASPRSLLSPMPSPVLSPPPLTPAPAPSLKQGLCASPLGAPPSPHVTALVAVVAACCNITKSWNGAPAPPPGGREQGMPAGSWAEAAVGSAKGGGAGPPGLSLALRRGVLVCKAGSDSIAMPAPPKASISPLLLCVCGEPLDAVLVKAVRAEEAPWQQAVRLSNAAVTHGCGCWCCGCCCGCCCCC